MLITFEVLIRIEFTLNNSNSSSEIEKFQVNWTALWNEELFREKTLLQIVKDFSLSGMQIKLEELKQCKSIEVLSHYIENKIADNPSPQLLYIIDLKEQVYDHLGAAIVQRIAFKVYLRMQFS